MGCRGSGYSTSTPSQLSRTRSWRWRPAPAGQADSSWRCRPITRWPPRRRTSLPWMPRYRGPPHSSCRPRVRPETTSNPAAARCSRPTPCTSAATWTRRFFCGENAHVVLRAKEARTQRPHGHVLRTGQARVPEESSLTSTVWMSGVFHSMVTQGHVSINRFLSTQHSWLGLFRSHGLRLFAQVDGFWQLLGVPSAFEMRPDSCRWIYRHARGVIEVVSGAEAGRNALSLRARVLDGPGVAWLSTLHLALGGDDGNSATPVAWRVQGKEVFVGVPEGSELHSRFPGGGFAVVLLEDAAPLVARGDGRLFTDGRPRGLPFL